MTASMNTFRQSNRQSGISRRTFGKISLMGALGAGAVISQGTPAHGKVQPLEPGIKLAAQIGSDPSEEDLLLVKQLGIEYVTIWTRGEQATYQYFVQLRDRVEKAGLKIWNIGNSDVHNMEEVTLNLPGRDEKVQEYIQYLRNIGRTGGIYYTTYAHMGNGIWSTEREETRGARARAFDLDKAQRGSWNGKDFLMPLTHGREFSEQEIWDNYEYFITRVAPVAEEEGIRIGIHPDDPPVPVLGGVPRCIFSNFDGYKGALEIADSPNVGICLCVGCWLEGGDLMGRDVIETIHYFGEQNKIFKVHFRNVDQPLPHFTETFMDDGYMDMYKVMRALKEVDFRGVIIADHVPGMVGGGRVGLSYSVGYMRALIERAQDELE